MDALEFDDWREALEFVRTWNAGLPPVKTDDQPVVVLQPASESLATAPPKPAALPEQPCTCPNCGKEFAHVRARNGHMTWCKPKDAEKETAAPTGFLKVDAPAGEPTPPEHHRPLKRVSASSFAHEGGKCPVCGREFSRNGPLAQHIRRCEAARTAALETVAPDTPIADIATPADSAPAQVARIQPEAFVPEWLTVFRLVTDQVERGDGPEAVCRRFALAHPWDKLTPGNCAAVLEDFSEDIARLTEARKSSLEQYQLEKLNLQTRLSAQPRIQCSGRRAQGASA